MAKAFIAGGSGRVATELIKDLVEKGHEVVAGARHVDNIVKSDYVTPVELDLTASTDDISKLMQGCEVVYFTAGSRGANLIQVDAMGAIKTMRAAEQLGIKRYVMLSSVYTLESEEKWHAKGLETLLDYTTAKFFADNYLVNDTNLDYTILQPTALTEEPGTGMIYIGKDIAGGRNPIPDVAQVLADVIDNEHTVKKVLMMKSGDTKIQDALNNC